MNRAYYGRPLVDPDNVNVARALQDLPAPVAGVITPVKNTTFLETKIDLEGNQFALPAGHTLTGYAGVSCGFIGTHATALVETDFAAAAGIASINNVSFNNSVGQGVVVDGGAVAAIDAVVFENDSGIIGNVLTVLNVDSCAFQGDSKILIAQSSVNGRLNVGRSGFFQGSAINSIEVATGVTLGIMNLDEISIATFAGGNGVLLVDDDTQVSFGSIELSTFTGAGTFLSGFDQKSDFWEIMTSFGLTQSCDQGTANTMNSSGPTVALTQNVWTDISDSGVVLIYADANTPEKFEITDTDTGEMTYNGVRNRCYKVSGRVNIEGNASAVIVEVGISVNGATPESNTIVNSVISNVGRDSVALPATPIDLEPGDTIKPQIRNITDSTDVDVYQAKLSAFF